MRKLRLGVIGAGAWSVASHLPRLALHRERGVVDFVAVNRRDPAMAESIRARFGFAGAHTHYSGVLEAEPDIVVVASPVRWHHEQAKAALQAGAHVLVEKPFTLHPDEARDLVATASATGRHLLIALGWHYKPMMIRAKELMDPDWHGGAGSGRVAPGSVVDVSPDSGSVAGADGGSDGPGSGRAAGVGSDSCGAGAGDVGGARGVGPGSGVAVGSGGSVVGRGSGAAGGGGAVGVGGNRSGEGSGGADVRPGGVGEIEHGVPHDRFVTAAGAGGIGGVGGGVGEIEHVSIVMSSTTREALVGRQPSFAADQTAGAIVSKEQVPELTPRPETLTDPAISGGGYAQAQLSHALGLALWLTGLRGAEVFALMSSPQSTAVEFHDSLSLRFAGGAIGSVSGASAHLGANAGKHYLVVQIIGSDGQLTLDLSRELLTRYHTDDGELTVPLAPGAGAYDCAGPIDALVALARGENVPNNSPGELGVRTVEIIEAAYRSAQTHHPEPVA